MCKMLEPRERDWLKSCQVSLRHLQDDIYMGGLIKQRHHLTL